MANIGPGRPNVVKPQNVKGTKKNDTLVANGGAGNDKIKVRGKAGDDQLNINDPGGNNKIIAKGGKGQDTINISDNLPSGSPPPAPLPPAVSGGGSPGISPPGWAYGHLIPPSPTPHEHCPDSPPGSAKSNNKVRVNGNPGEDTVNINLTSGGNNVVRTRGGLGADAQNVQTGDGKDKIIVKDFAGSDTIDVGAGGNDDNVKLRGNRAAGKLSGGEGRDVLKLNKKYEDQGDGTYVNKKTGAKLEVEGFEKVKGPKKK